MGSSKKNLLEAFRNAGDVPLPQDEKHDDSLQPLTPEEERLLAEETRLQADLTRGGKHSWKSELPPLPPWVLYVAGAGVLLVIVLAIAGLGKDDGVQASEEGASPAAEPALVPADPGPTAGAPPTPQPEVTPQAGGPNAPLLDPANAWTVVVITYSRSATSAEDLAWASHDHLREAGIPVFPPFEIGNKIVVLAGAAPRSSDLSDLKTRIGSLSRDGRPNIYAGAYAERIDKFIDRY